MHAQTQQAHPTPHHYHHYINFHTHALESWLTPFPTMQLFHYGNVILNPQQGPNALVENTETLQTTPTHPPTGAIEAHGQNTT